MRFIALLVAAQEVVVQHQDQGPSDEPKFLKFGQQGRFSRYGHARNSNVGNGWLDTGEQKIKQWQQDVVAPAGNIVMRQMMNARSTQATRQPSAR